MQRVTGHDATSVAAIPPTALSLAHSENEEEVSALCFFHVVSLGRIYGFY